LILALIISLFTHVSFALLSPEMTEVSQPSSSSRMSVAMSWREIKPIENKPVNVEEKSQKEQKKATKPEKNIVKSAKIANEKIAVTDKTNLVKKPNKVIENKIEPALVDTPKVEKKAAIEELKQKPVIAETVNAAPIDTAQQDKIIEKVEDVQQVITDKQEDAQSSRFQIGSNANPKPNYPSLAVKRGWQGEVVLGVHVRPDGSIEHLTFVKSTNYGVLNFEAYETVRTLWHFKAIEDENDQSETTYIEVPITFNIANR
jgi:TonB family protein